MLLLPLAYKVFHNLNVLVVISRFFIKPLHNYLHVMLMINFMFPSAALKIVHDSPILECIYLWNDSPVDIKMLLSLKKFGKYIIETFFSL